MDVKNRYDLDLEGLGWKEKRGSDKEDENADEDGKKKDDIGEEWQGKGENDKDEKNADEMELDKK